MQQMSHEAALTESRGESVNFHKDVALLHYEEISERRFSGWSMGQVNVSKLNQSILLKYSEKPELDPYAVSGKVSLSLLDDLAATAAICGRS